MSLRTATPVIIPNVPSPLGGADLSVDLILQEQTEWCWAACMQMVFKKHGDLITKQCMIANAAFDLQGCCTAPSSSLCNKPCPILNIGTEWQRWGVLPALLTQSTVSFNTIKFELDPSQQRPVEVGIRWNGGGGQAILITGWDEVNGVPYVTVNDPTYGKSQVEYETLVSHYNGTGSWKWSWTGLRKG